MKDKGLTNGEKATFSLHRQPKNKQFKCFIRAVREGCNFPRCCIDALRFEGKQGNFRRLGKQESLSTAMVFDDFVVNLKYVM